MTPALIWLHLQQRAMLALAAGEIEEAGFARWIRDHAVPRQAPAR